MKNYWLQKWQCFFGENQKPDSSKSFNIFESIFQSSSDGYLVYSKETQKITEMNEMVATLLELPPEINLKGLYISQVMMRYLTVDSPNLGILLNNVTDSWSGEAEFNTYTKKKLYGYVNTNIFTSTESEYQVMSIRDITERRESRDEMIQIKINSEQATRSKTRFLSSMSHELRTPLNGIIGTSDLILTEPGLQENIKHHLKVIQYSSGHMLSIINDILNFSKLDSKKDELIEAPFDILKCLEYTSSSLSLQFKKKNLEFVTDFPGNELKNIKIISDELKLSQVINNLLSNSLKFTDFGKVNFSLKIKESTDSDIILLFEIKDTGVGIAKNMQEEIFQPFIQVYSDDLKRRYGGNGLGLAISRQLVNMLGGELEVDSELYKGSNFHFTISFKIASQHVPEINPVDLFPEPAKDIRGLKVLVVEDNEINANVLIHSLTKWQMQIKVAITGVHALELIKYHKFDLILMDLEMPQMNGYTALKKIRELNINSPVIALTATLLENVDSLITEAGFTDYVSKPFRAKDLRKKIEMYCERQIDYT